MKVLILGYGDVGKTVARILTSRGVNVVVVDVKDVTPESGIEFIRGDVTDESFWEGFDISDFNYVVVALPDDLHAVFCVLMIKSKKKDMVVYARCNSTEYVEKLYKAGADHVVNLPVVAAEMILSEIFGEEIRRRLTFENIEVKVYMVEKGSKLKGMRVGEIKNIIVLGVECDGKIVMDPDFVLKDGCLVAVAGKVDELVKFEAEYLTTS